MSKLAEEVRLGHARGWCYIALRGNTKIPRLKGWQNLYGDKRASLEQCLAWVVEGNVGILTGIASGFIVVDEDGGAGVDLPETVTVLTGGGGGRRQCYYQLPKRLKLKNWVGQLGEHVDLRVDGGQVLSVGCMHPDTQQLYTWAPGLSPTDQGIADCPEDLLEQLHDRMKPTRKSATAPAATPIGINNRYVQAAVQGEVKAIGAAGKGTRNDKLNIAAFNLGQFVGAGALGESEVTGILLDAARGWIGDECSETELRQTIRSGLEAGRRQPRAVPEAKAKAKKNGHAVAAVPAQGQAQGQNQAQAASTDFPADNSGQGGDYLLIPGAHVTDEGQYVEIGNHAFADAVLSHLPAGEIYRRADLLGTITGKAGNKKFRRISNDDVRTIIDRYCRLGAWIRKRGGDDQLLHYKNCSRDMGGLISSAAVEHPNVRDLRVITPYPTFVPGLELAAAGWNDHGVFFDEAPAIKGVAPETDADVIRATLDDLLVDFPFKSPADRQNFIGLMLTPIVRPSLDGNVPMHLIMAPLERTGKSKLAEDVFGGVLTGRPTPALQLGGSEEERDKRVTSLLLTGGTIAHLDNLSQQDRLDSGVLASLLTASVYQGRVLGVSDVPLLPNNLTLVASGNNVKATGEIVKRTVPIHLQPPTESPETRSDFRHPHLREYVTGARRRVLSCLLGMVQVWKQTGTPAGTVRLGGFERWAEVIGGVMLANGYPAWMTNAREWIRDADTDGADLRILVEAWHGKFGTGTVPASDVMKMAQNLGVFPSVFVAQTEQGRMVAFSRRVLSAYSGAPVGAWRIRRLSSGNNTRYQLEPLEQAQVARAS